MRERRPHRSATVAASGSTRTWPNNARTMIGQCAPAYRSGHRVGLRLMRRQGDKDHDRSEEHTSELQSQFHLVCRLLLEKKKKKKQKKHDNKYQINRLHTFNCHM